MTVLNMLRRNPYFAPRSVKFKAYMSCVLPILEYASTSWQPTSDKSENALEMVQHNAARFISNVHYKKGQISKISITNILNNLHMETLEARRIQSRLNMAYKIINGHIILGPNMLPKSANNGKQRKCNDTNVGFDNQLIEPVPNLQTSGKPFSTLYRKYGTNMFQLHKLKLRLLMHLSDISEAKFSLSVHT